MKVSTFGALFYLFSLVPLNSAYSGSNLSDPGNLGPYGIGHVNIKNPGIYVGPGFEGLPGEFPEYTNLSIWYPSNTSAADSPADYSTYDGYYPGASYTLPSPFGAKNGTPIASGKFPLILDDHTDGGSLEDFGRFQLWDTAEHLASHGFIVVSYNHRTGRASRVHDVPVVLDYMVNNSSLKDYIDKNKIGISGSSASIFSNLDLISLGLEPKIKATILYDTAYYPSIVSTNYSGNINVPVLHLKSSKTLPGLAVVLASKNQSTPIINILFPRAEHTMIGNPNLCQTINVERELAISRHYQNNPNAQPGYDPLIDPEGDPNGESANYLWNLDTYTKLGGGSQYCDVSSWGTPVPETLFAPGRISIMKDTEFAPYRRIFTTAFWKVYLSGETQYGYFLSKDYFNTIRPENVNLIRN